MIKLIKPDDAVLQASRRLSENFIRVSRNKNDTFYFGKRGYPWKIRISNHIDATRNDDVINDIVFDSPTTVMDIDYKVRKAVEEFGWKINNLERKRGVR